MDDRISQSSIPHDQTGIVVRLRLELDRLLSGADDNAAFAALSDGSAGREIYLSFLTETRHYVARTYPTLTAAGRRLRDLQRHEALADLFVQKAEEETGHDILIDDDIAALGLDVETALAAGPGRWVTTYNSWIAAVAAGEHPAAFLGSAYVLEGLAVERAGVIAEAMKSAGHIPGIARAVSFLHLHAIADVGHVEDLERMLAALTDPVEADAIVMTAAATRVSYLGMLDEIASAGVRMDRAA